LPFGNVMLYVFLSFFVVQEAKANVPKKKRQLEDVVWLKSRRKEKVIL
jgi:hypothetical protein